MTRGKRETFTPAPVAGRWIVHEAGSRPRWRAAHYYLDGVERAVCAAGVTRERLTDDDPDVTPRCGLCRQRVYGWRAASGA